MSCKVWIWKFQVEVYSPAAGDLRLQLLCVTKVTVAGEFRCE